MNIVFNGKKEAEKIATFLEESEKLLGKSLVIFQCDGKTEMSQYVKLKTEMGERLGVIVNVDFRSQISDLRSGIEEMNEDDTVDGILIQLPIIESKELKNSKTQELKMLKGQDLFEILGMIKPGKDVDGLNPQSNFLPAAVRAVERTVESFNIDDDQKIALVGSKGMVGKRIGERLNVLRLPFEGFDMGDDLSRLKEFDVIISSTGVEGLITEDMVTEGFIGIDLGYPKGDISKEAGLKASLITPVPNGVGPLTVVGLFENLAEI
jgi:methylenetetrahydrofolate dehydrogenase (NADP+)/methenyltetrahydrofolate cyclohydrolase